MTGDSLAETDRVVHRPTESFVESANVSEFMQKHDIDGYEELVERTTRADPGTPASGVDWFWDTVVDYLDVEFFEPYDRVRDDSRGPQFTEWYPGGTTNLAHNVLDRHAARDADARNSVAVLWAAYTGDDPGDTSSIENPAVIEEIAAAR